MFNPNGYENARPDGVAVLEILQRPEVGAPSGFVPLRRTEVGGEIIGPLAALSVVHTFRYTREQCDQVLEAIYRFPLPGDAAVTGVTATFGDVEIRAELKARAQAEADYAQARAEGRQGALVTREAPNVFSLQVTGLQPDQEIAVETHYVQLARPAGVGWTLRIPLTTAPRYTRSDERTSRHSQGQPLLLLRDPGHRFSLDLLIPGAAAVESSTHALAIGDEDGRARVRLKEREVVPDRDCVLFWRPAQAEGHPRLHVLTHDDPIAGQTYFLAMIAPPAIHDVQSAVPREVVLAVDHSGSMNGPKWAAADWAASSFLGDLTPRDAFGLELFHSTTCWLSTRLQAGTAEAVDRARQFLADHRDSGGTELGVALEQALSLERAPGERARHVLIVTDAQVTDDGRILRLAEEESGLAHHRRISILCIDAAPNSFLAMEIAERGGGVARFLTSNPAEEDITTALDEVLADWSQPVLADLRLEVNRASVAASGRIVRPASSPDWSGIDLGDLPAGRTVWAVGRVARAGGPLNCQVAGAGGQVIASSPAEPVRGPYHGRALKALFGARRVLGIEFLIGSGLSGQELVERLERLGYDPQQDLSLPESGRRLVYAENVRARSLQILGDLLLRESLAYGLLSSATGFVAVRTEAGRRSEGTIPVAGALPAGWSEDFTGAQASHVRFRRAGGGAAAARFASMAAGYAPPAEAERSALSPGDADSPGDEARSSVKHYKPISSDQFVEGSPADETRFSGKWLNLQRRLLPQSAQRTGGRTPRLDRVRFDGIPQFRSGEALLVDSSRPEDAARVPDSYTFSSLRFRFVDPVPAPESLAQDLTLLVFVDDLAAPRAVVTLRDLLRQGGKRPLNLLKQAGQPLRIVLKDPKGRWAIRAPRIEVVLS
ncbi:MAG: VWA domain-containing protein [Chloroflexi bacterium]|nr:VWA domain-containing protein [Chloroflexota bacterium]